MNLNYKSRTKAVKKLPSQKNSIVSSINPPKNFNENSTKEASTSTTTNSDANATKKTLPKKQSRKGSGTMTPINPNIAIAADPPLEPW